MCFASNNSHVPCFWEYAEKCNQLTNIDFFVFWGAWEDKQNNYYVRTYLFKRFMCVLSFLTPMFPIEGKKIEKTGAWVGFFAGIFGRVREHV